MAQPPDPPPESAAARPGRPAPAPGHPCPAAPRLQRLRARWPPGRAPARPLRRGSRLPPATPARNTDTGAERPSPVPDASSWIPAVSPGSMRRPSCISARNFGYRLDFVARHMNRSSAMPARAVDPDRNHLARVVGGRHHPGLALQRRRPDHPHPTADVHAKTAGYQRPLLRLRARQRRLTRGTVAGRAGRGEAPTDYRAHATADSVACSVSGPGPGLPAGHHTGRTNSYRGESRSGPRFLLSATSPEPSRWRCSR